MSEFKRLQQILDDIEVDKDSIRSSLGNTRVHSFFMEASSTVFRAVAAFGFLTLLFKSGLTTVAYICAGALVINLAATLLIVHEEYRLQKQLEKEFDKFKAELKRRGISDTEMKEMLVKSKDPQ